MKPLLAGKVAVYAMLFLVAACAGSCHAQAVNETAIKGILKTNVQYAATGSGGELTIEVQREPIIGMQMNSGQVTNRDLQALKECGVNTISLRLPLGSLKENEIKETKRIIGMLKDKGFTVFWLSGLNPVSCERFLSSKADISKVDWKGRKINNRPCYRNPQVKEAFNKAMQECVQAMVKHNIYPEGIIMNEPGQIAGEFCYCRHCSKLFQQKHGLSMPKPVNLEESTQSSIPVNWPAGLPKAKYMQESGRVAWSKMAEFYCEPVTERIEDIFKHLRSGFSQISCQVTTLTDIHPYYGLDFWNGVMNIGQLDGIQTAIYWAVGKASPLTAGDERVARKFVGTAQKRGLSCYYWLQGYDCGDNSGPLKPGEIQVAVREAFAREVDGILIWSYLNPIRGPWNKPYGWDEYLVDLGEAVAPYLNKPADKCRVVVNINGSEKTVNGNGTEGWGQGGVYRIKTAKPADGKIRLTVYYPACRPLQQEIKIDDGGQPK